LAHVPGEKLILLTDTRQSTYTITHHPNLSSAFVGYEPVIIEGYWKP
jgi:hypothetical protein